MLAVAFLLAAGWFGLAQFRSRRVTLEFGNGGAAAPTLELVFFPDQLAFTAPSPPPPIGRLDVLGAAAVTVGSDLVPEHAVVRYAGAGVGTGFMHVRLGQPPARVLLRPPQVLVGRVVEPIAMWCFGWRCSALRPVAGAEIIVMGGGEHGIALASAQSDADGRFAIEGLDLALDGLGLRTRAPGFAIAHLPLHSASGDAPEPAVALARTTLLRGRITGLPEADVDPTSLRVFARGLPGVEATPAADGTFELDHVPADTQPRLLLYGLPGLLTHASVRAEQDLLIRVVLGASVFGQVVDASSRQPLAAALVFCGDDQAVRTDASGNFELSRLLPGPTEIQAQFEVPTQRRRTTTRSGRQRVQLQAGKTLENVVVAVD